LSGQRGQTIPVWTFGIITTLMLMLMVFNYANAVRWQIRAQNAADAVAQAIMSVQTSHYNQILMTLHAAAIEEYRIREDLNAMLLILQGAGGCTTGLTPTNTGTGPDCTTAYNNLRANYIAAVGRYGQDVAQMTALNQYTQTQQIADMQAIAQSFETTCTSTGPAGGDCIFKFTVATPTARPSVSGVLNDAGGTRVGAGAQLPGIIPADLQPLQIEVDACASVQTPFAALFKMNVAPFVALGRAGATSAMVTQEWFNPGTETNPNSPGGAAFQAPEFPYSSTNTGTNYNAGSFCTANSGSHDWYAVHYCSNKWVAVFTPPVSPDPNPVYGGFAANITFDEFSVWTGWWSALPVAPYSGLFTPSATNCAQNVSFNA
jgi:Putative Flp pilus-assembly TadE/G-like